MGRSLVRRAAACAVCCALLLAVWAHGAAADNTWSAGAGELSRAADPIAGFGWVLLLGGVALGMRSATRIKRLRRRRHLR